MVFRPKPVSLVLLATFLQLLIALLSESLSFTHEEAMWHYIGRNWFRNGLTPYSGGIDNKSPFIFAVFGLSDHLFGVNYWFPRLMGAIVQSVGLFYVYKITYHIAGARAGIIAIIVYGLSVLWKSSGGTYVSFTETYSVTLLIIAFYLSLTYSAKGRPLLGGLISGIALAFRLTAIFGIIAIAVNCLRNGISAFVAFLGGLFFSVAMVLLVFHLLQIDFDSLARFAFLDNFSSNSVTDHSLAWKADQFAKSFFYSEIVLFYPGLVGYLLYSKKNHQLTIWLMLEFFGIVLLGIFARNHLKHLLPSLAIINAIAINHFITAYKIPFRESLVLLAVIFFPKTFDPLFGIKKSIGVINDRSEELCSAAQTLDGYSKKQLGLWIRSITQENDMVYVAGHGAQIQVYSERISPARYFNVTQTALAVKTTFEDLHSYRPAIIAVPKNTDYIDHVNADMRKTLSDLLERNYQLYRCKYGYDIYKAK